MISDWLFLILLAVVAGNAVYCVLTVVACSSYLGVRPPEAEVFPPISVLQPLAGVDDGLEGNLRSLFAQEYPDYEILFAVRQASDPAAAVAGKLIAEHPSARARLMVTGDPPYPNAKVFSLDRMLEAARHDLLVMNDSDIRVGPDMLKVVAAEFQDPSVGLATCPYRAAPTSSVWSILEALGMNTHFLAGVLVARMLEGMKFALGPSIVARREVIDAIGGFSRLKDFLAEDFVLGKYVHEMGHRVILSSYLTEHRIGGSGFRSTLTHRLRWARSTRRSRPKGYVGEVFTNPLPPALLCVLWRPEFWWAAAATVALRAAAAWATAWWVLKDPLFRKKWWLTPVEDFERLVFWVLGFFGSHVTWRGRRYYLHRDGRFELVQ